MIFFYIKHQYTFDWSIKICFEFFRCYLEFVYSIMHFQWIFKNTRESFLHLLKMCANKKLLNTFRIFYTGHI